MTKVIRIVAAVIRDDAGRALLVRKRDTQAFMQPGGKIEAGEDHLTALARELDEELGCRFEASAARFLGQFTAPSANEPGFTVEAAIYEVAAEGEIGIRAEIAEMQWVDPAAVPAGMILAPLTRDHILPKLV